MVHCVSSTLYVSRFVERNYTNVSHIAMETELVHIKYFTI